MIELRSIGTAEIHTGSATLTPSQEIVFGAGLYLILERGRRIRRNRMALLLWPNASELVRNHRLRQTIHQLKKLGFVVRADRNVIELGKNEAKVDADSLKEHCSTGSEILHSLEFLPGYRPRFSEGLGDWVDAARERVHSVLTRELLEALRASREAGDWPSVERISSHCLKLDEYNEAAVLARAEACAMRGQKAKALSILDTYVNQVSPENPSLILPANILRKRVLQNDERQVRARVSAEPAFIGRGSEMATLTRFVERARRGTGAGCLIHGEAGIGKTRLSSEVATFAELQGVSVHRIACKRADTHQPLASFVALVPMLRELPGALGCSYTSLIWLRRLTEFDSSTQEVSPQTEDSGTLYTNLRAAIFDLLDAVSDERPLLILVEDIQWLDHASAHLFASILEGIRSKKILFLFNSREPASPLTESVSPDYLTVLPLAPISNSYASAIIRATMGSPADGHGADLDWLINAGEGNPFFLQELTKHWLETGLKHDVPPSVASVLDDRLSRLSGLARQLLQACAVLGEHSNVERLEKVLEYRSHELLEGMQELSTSGMLRSTGPDGATQIIYVRHDLLSIQILKTLAPASLAFLHRRCGLVIEQEAFGKSISISLMRACAFHWYHSGESDRAYNLAIKCADHLLEIGLASDAAKAFDGALAFCSGVDAQREIAERIIQANRIARNWPLVLNGITRFRALDSSGPIIAHHDDLEVLEFEALRITQAPIASVFKKYLACVYDETLAAAHRVKVAVVAVKLAAVIPDLKELERVYLSISPLLQDSTLDSRSRLQLTVIYHTMCGDLGEALRCARERVAFERRQMAGGQLINSMTDLAFVLRRTGPHGEMIDVLREAYDVAMEHKDYASARECAGRIASLFEDTGWGDMGDWSRRAVDQSGDVRDVASSFSLNASMIRIAIRKNCLVEARARLEREFDWEWLTHRGGLRAAALALPTTLLVAEGADMPQVRSDVEDLMRLYPATAGLGGQDYEIYGLCCGLIYLNKRAEAKEYLLDYLSKRRRDLTEYSLELGPILKLLGTPAHRDASLSSKMSSTTIVPRRESQPAVS